MAKKCKASVLRNHTLQCSNCGSNDLEFSLNVKTPNYIADGRLRANECQPIAVLGCKECSETLAVYEEHEVVQMLNSTLEKHD